MLSTPVLLLNDYPEGKSKIRKQHIISWLLKLMYNKGGKIKGKMVIVQLIQQNTTSFMSTKQNKCSG